MNYQEIIEPVFSLKPVRSEFTNDGEIDLLYRPSVGYKNEQNFKIIRRRFPDGSVKWFEEVQF